jgi:hypothetical protein
MEVIVMKIVIKEAGTMVAGLIGSGVSPLAGNGLDEAFGLAVGLGPIRLCEVVFDAELFAGGGKESGAIGRAAIGEHALDLDAVEGVEADGLFESVDDAGDFFVGQETSEGEAGVIVDGDVETFDAGAWIANGAIAGGANAGALETAQFLDVEVEEFAGGGAFVALGRRFWRFESGEAVEAVAAQHAGEGGLGDVKDGEDLGVGAALATQGEDLGFEFGAGFAGLAPGNRGLIFEALREAGMACALEPSADGLFADAVSGCGGPKREVASGELKSHLGSHQWGESGISVHVVRAGFGCRLS